MANVYFKSQFLKYRKSNCKSIFASLFLKSTFAIKPFTLYQLLPAPEKASQGYFQWLDPYHIPLDSPDLGECLFWMENVQLKKYAYTEFQNIHSGFFCKKLFYKKLGSNSGKFKKLLRNWWGWDPQKFKKLEAWDLVDWLEMI